MAVTNYTGPVQSDAGFQAGSSTIITFKERGTISVTITALAAAAEEDLDIAITNVTVGDSVIVTPTEAAMETGVSISGAWVKANGTITIRISNQSGSGLTGSTETWDYLLTRS